ncbi:hypothetical protein AAKU64_004664 [Undibacterium sp. GrIS 1.8]|uniref:hypothetical protein n=1 Tax=Undibacterium sp. GrIS 1.8 TaxID=3143934 RepID=UPI003395E1D0
MQIPKEILSSLESYATQIDNEEAKIKMSAIEIGRNLLHIHNALGAECFVNRVSELFQLICDKRFGKKKTWGYQMMQLSNHFLKEDPVFERLPVSTLMQLNRLSKDELDDIRDNLVQDKKLTRSQVKALVDLIIAKRDGDNILEENREELVSMQEKLKGLERNLSQTRLEKSQVEKDLELKSINLENSITRMRDIQDSESNITRMLNATRDEVKALEGQLADAKRRNQYKKQSKWKSRFLLQATPQ